MDPNEINHIRAAQQGDRRAFDALIQLHERRTLQVIVGIVGDRDDAHDVFQNTFIRAWTKLRTFRFESAFGTWITRIAINQALNQRKKRRWKQRLSLDALRAERPVQEPTTTKEPMADLMNTELGDRITSSMDALSDRERAVFTLKHMHGYKIREIAAMIDCAEGTVKNYLFRATQKMRSALQPYYEHAG